MRTSDHLRYRPGGEFNIHIGARSDFPNQPVGVAQLFRGTLDDVRPFRRALTTEEAALVKDGSLAVATGAESLRVGFSTIWWAGCPGPGANRPRPGTRCGTACLRRPIPRPYAGRSARG